MKKKILLALVVVFILSIFGGCRNSSTKNSTPTVMSPESLDYVVSRMYWSGYGNSKNTLCVDGYFRNFSTKFDVLYLNNTTIYVVDEDDNILAKKAINVKQVGSLKAGESRIYNMTFFISGGYNRYKDEAIDVQLETEFQYQAK